jgi:dipeptidase E
MKHLFLTSSIENLSVTQDIFKKIGKSAPLKTLCIKTATEDKKRQDLSWYEDDKNGLRNAGFEVIEFSVTGKSENELRVALDAVDVVFVSGGNTFYLLQESQKTGFIKIIQEKVAGGMIYIGSSAGSVIAGPDIETVLGIDNVKLAPEINGYVGYNLVNFCVLPHWSSDDFKKTYLTSNLEPMYKSDYPLITLTNDQYIEVKDNQFKVIDVRNRK